MNNKRTYYWLWGAVGVLLLLNLLTVGWVLRRTVPARRAARPLTEGVIIRQLAFSADQARMYRQTRQQLRRQTRPHEDSLRQLRQTFLRRVRDPAISDAELDELTDRMARQNRQINRFRFRHWQQVRSLCTPDQQTRFDQSISQLGQRADALLNRRRRQEAE